MIRLTMLSEVRELLFSNFYFLIVTIEMWRSSVLGQVKRVTRVKGENICMEQGQRKLILVIHV